MGIKITTIDEAIINNGLKILVYGPAGSGKTRLTVTADSKTLLVSVEGGLLSIKNVSKKIKKLVDVIVIEKITDLQSVYELLTKKHLYSWVCIDSLAEIAEQILVSEKKKYKDKRQAYGSMAESITEFIKLFRDLENCNVLFTAKQEREKDELSGKMLYRPMLEGRVLPNKVPYLFDEVFAMRVFEDDEGEAEFWMQTKRCSKYDCKDRSGKLDKWEEPSLFDILTKIEDGEKENG